MHIFPDIFYICTPARILVLRGIGIEERSSASISSFSSTAGDAHVNSSRQLTLHCVKWICIDVGGIFFPQAGAVFVTLHYSGRFFLLFVALVVSERVSKEQ